MKRKLARWILRVCGWKIQGHIAHQLRKYVVVTAPHTSWWDFPLGVLVRTAIGRKIHFIAKSSLFRGPFGFIFRWLGGYPVERSKSKKQVDQIVAIFKSKEDFAIALAPEGTRKKVDTLRTGFYYIAKAASVPIILTKLDYGNRVVEFSEPFWPGTDTNADLQAIRRHFSGVKGKHPELSIT